MFRRGGRDLNDAQSSIDFKKPLASKINAEFSLQSVSHNSRVNNQRHYWSQICEKWTMFIIRYCWRRYTILFSFHSYFYRLFAAKALL